MVIIGCGAFDGVVRSEPVSADDPDGAFSSPWPQMLICLTENPRVRSRDMAARARVIERAAMRLIDRLDRAGPDRGRLLIDWRRT